MSALNKPPQTVTVYRRPDGSLHPRIEQAIKRGSAHGITYDVRDHAELLARTNKPWFPPPVNERPDGFECLVWHRGRWRHVKWVPNHSGWMLGYASAHIPGDLGRLFAPLPWNTPEVDFWEGQNS